MTRTKLTVRMVRLQLTANNPIELNTMAKIISENPRLEVTQDSGNKPGKRGWIRYIHLSIKRKGQAASPDAEALAKQVWRKLVHETDTDDEAAELLKRLILVCWQTNTLTTADKPVVQK